MIPVALLRSVDVAVVGVGAVGRHVAMRLAEMGAERLMLVDPDTVSVTNYGSQGYRPDQLGDAKVDALADDIANVRGDTDMVTLALNKRVSYPDLLGTQLVFLCVDSMDARKLVAGWLPERPDVVAVVDTRMDGVIMRNIVAANTEAGRKFYAETLFDDKDAYDSGRCSGRVSSYTASWCAAIAVHQYVRVLRQMASLTGPPAAVTLTQDIITTINPYDHKDPVCEGPGHTSE